MNSITISFAKSGFILSVDTEEGSTNEVFVSQGKLNKAIRTAIDELSLLPKKAEDGEASE